MVEALGARQASCPVARDVGYPVLFALVAIETMGIPVPGETAIFTAGILASRDELQIEIVIAVAAAAAIIGDNIGFAIGRRYGRRLLLVPGPLEHHRRRVIELGEPFFERHGPKAVFLGRWVTGLRITSAWLAGREPDVVADVPVLERARRDLLGGGRRARRVLPGPRGRAGVQRRGARRRGRGRGRRRDRVARPCAGANAPATGRRNVP